MTAPGSEAPLVTALQAAIENVLKGRAWGGQGQGFNADMHWERTTAAILADEAVRAALSGSAPQPPTSPDFRAALRGAEDWAIQKEWDRAYAVLRRAVKHALAASQEPSTGDDR